MRRKHLDCDFFNVQCVAAARDRNGDAVMLCLQHPVVVSVTESSTRQCNPSAIKDKANGSATLSFGPSHFKCSGQTSLSRIFSIPKAHRIGWSQDVLGALVQRLRIEHMKSGPHIQCALALCEQKFSHWKRIVASLLQLVPI